MSIFQKTNIGKNDLAYDAWGKAKTSKNYSLFYGVWTFIVPYQLWIEYYDGTEQDITNFTSENGVLKGVSNGGTAVLAGKRHPRYQPNRGHLYSNSFIIDNATTTNGTLYACLKSNGVVTHKEAITLPNGYDPSKGNIYDIQMQWRGVGNVKYFINQIDVTPSGLQNILGALTALSVENPALPVRFEAINDGTILFGLGTEINFVYFEWEFDTPQETQFRCGCVDISSEGGSKSFNQYVSIATSTNSGQVPIDNAYNQPIMAITMPNQINGKHNTIDLLLERITAYADAKSLVRVWFTRDSTALTLDTGIVWSDIEYGNIQKVEALAIGDLTLDTTKCKQVYSGFISADSSLIINNPNSDNIEFPLTHGDYLIVTLHQQVGQAMNGGCSIELSEEI